MLFFAIWIFVKNNGTISINRRRIFKKRSYQITLQWHSTYDSITVFIFIATRPINNRSKYRQLSNNFLSNNPQQMYSKQSQIQNYANELVSFWQLKIIARKTNQLIQLALYRRLFFWPSFFLIAFFFIYYCVVKRLLVLRASYVFVQDFLIINETPVCYIYRIYRALPRTCTLRRRSKIYIQWNAWMDEIR